MSVGSTYCVRALMPSIVSVDWGMFDGSSPISNGWRDGEIASWYWQRVAARINQLGPPMPSL